MILVDAHVHIYPCYNLAAFFNAAHDNFYNEAKRFEVQKSFDAFLLLADLTTGKWFDRIKTCADTNNSPIEMELGSWRIHETGDPLTIQMVSRDGKKLYLVAGRQIITLERIEVLALFSDHPYIDGKSLDNTIASIRNNDAIPVIPWGAGKWMGKRGTLLTNIISRYPANYFMLGDNGGRPKFWPSPTQFAQARSRGTQILPGSDPLPLLNESTRPGSFGFTLPGSVTKDRPGSYLKKLVADSESQKDPFGIRHGLSTFIANQLALRLRKRCHTQP
jgi:hypothetical protein